MSISVICSNYNSEKWIDSYLNSLNDQFLENFEVVFVDALSGDTIGVYSISGKSGSSGFSGDTGSVTRGIAKKIVKLIEANSQIT